MFAKKTSLRPRESIETLLGPNSQADGDIEFQGGLRVEGVLRGNITARGSGDSLVVVGPSGRVDGTVTAPTVIVHGTIQGDLVARRVELKADAKIQGDVHYASLAMEQGAVVNGNLYCDKEGAPQPPAADQGKV